MGLSIGWKFARERPFLSLTCAGILATCAAGALVFSKDAWVSLRVGASGVKFVQTHVSQLGIKILMSIFRAPPPADATPDPNAAPGQPPHHQAGFVDSELAQNAT
jgi:hypothetical protein